MFGKGNRQGDRHVQYPISDQTHETLRNLPVMDCDKTGHTGKVKGPNNETQCRGCGKGRCTC